jgi:hypothetical protein
MATVRRNPDHDHRGSQRHRAHVAWVCRPGAVLAWDDDRGSAANARIVRMPSLTDLSGR